MQQLNWNNFSCFTLILKIFDSPKALLRLRNC